MSLNNKNRNTGKFFILFFLLILTLFLSSCNNVTETVVEKSCEKTSLEGYQNYLEVPQERIDYFSMVNIALILDTSGSMQGERLAKAKTSAQWLLEELDSRISVGLLEFNTNSTILEDFTKERNNLEQAIKQIQAQGSTYFVPALNLANRMFINTNINSKIIKDMIIFISDGQPKDNYNDIIEHVNEITDKNICVYTIQYTSNDETEKQEQKELQKVLKKIAEISEEKTTCGKFYSDVGDKSNLVEVFADIYKQIKTVNYETFFDIRKNNEIYLYNETIDFEFRLLSVYNLQPIPNQKNCIDPIETKITLRKQGEILENINYTLDSKNKNYELKFYNLTTGEYELDLEVFFGENDEKSVKAFKKITFSVVDDPKYLECPTYNCDNYFNSINKEIMLTKNINITEFSCITNDLVFNKTTKINFFNSARKNKIIEIVSNDVSLFSSKIKPNETFSYVFFNDNSYKINCHYTLDEIIIPENDRDFFVAIDNSISMNGLKLKQAKLVAKELIRSKKEITKLYKNITEYENVTNIESFESNISMNETNITNIQKKISKNKIALIEFNDVAREINHEQELTFLDKKIDSIKTTGNSNIISLFELLEKMSNETSIFEITIISDGQIHDDITKTTQKIRNAYKSLIDQGHCINVIIYDDDSSLSEIAEYSFNKTGCGKTFVKGKKYFENSNNFFRKITIENYFKKPFLIENKVIYDNQTNMFTENIDFEIEVDITENDFLATTDNFYDIKCGIDLNVLINLYKDNNLFKTVSAKKITDNKYYGKFTGIPKYNYVVVSQVYIQDKNSIKCENIGSSQQNYLEFSNKLIVS